MKSVPTFSILTPVYNVEKFLNTCINSVLAQTFTDWELVLVDDGSTDLSGRICDDFAAKYPDKIRVFHKPNEGLLQTRRYAFAQANGKYYVILDSDDSLKENALQTLSDTFEKYACDCVVYGLADVVDGQVIKISAQEPIMSTTDKRLFCKKILLNSQYNAIWRKAFKAKCVRWQNYANCQVKHGEDLLQSLEILHNSDSVVFIPDALYNYRANLVSITHTPDVKSVADFLEVSQAVLEFLKNEQIFSKQDLQELHDYYIFLLEEKIKYIFRLQLPFYQKKEILSVLKGHPFCREFLFSSSYVQPRRVLYCQFRWGWFSLLGIQVQLYDNFKKRIKH